MRSFSWRWLPVLAFTSLLLPSSPVWAGDPAAAEPMDARGWLGRIHAAANQRNYQGTLVFTAGGAPSSSRVAHYCVGEQSFERLEALDGRMQRVYRHNDIVHTVWPQARVAVVERRSALTDLPAPMANVDPRALDHYELRAEGIERVAGREARVLLLQPRDELRYAQRLWADRATGLMLRSDVLGSNRSVLESTAFSSVEIGVRSQAEALQHEIKLLDNFRVVRAQPQRTQLEAEGWSLSRPVPGFQLAACIKRPLDATLADGPASDQVLQAVYTDGLTHVSVFIEAFDAKRHRAALVGQLGATSTLMQRRGDHWLTVMGDVPPSTLKLFAQALERQR